MPVFDDRLRLVSMSERERLELSGDWPEIVALYLGIPVDDRVRLWPHLWREHVGLHPEWKDYLSRRGNDIDGYIRWIFEDFTEAERAELKAMEVGRRELSALPNVTRNCLIRNGIRSGAQVCATTDKELLSLRNFGVGNLRYARQHFPYNPPEERSEWQWEAI